MVATRTLALAAGLLVACSSHQREASPCADELRKIVVPALEGTLGGGDADAFDHATTKFTTGSICGPDLAALIRDWRDALREPDAAKAATRRHTVIQRLDEFVSDKEMEAERRALAGVIAKAKGPR